MKAPVQKNTEIRCGNCNRLLAKGVMEAGQIQIFCPRCKTRHILRASSPNLAPHDGLCGDSYAPQPISQS